MGGIEWQRATAFGASAGGSQRRGPSELADLARELTGAKAGDRRLVIEAIATDHIDRAFKHEPGWGMALADVEDDFTGYEIPRRAAREAPRRVDLARIEHGKKLVTAGLDDAHWRSPGSCPVFTLAGYTTNSNSRRPRGEPSPEQSCGTPSRADQGQHFFHGAAQFTAFAPPMSFLFPLQRGSVHADPSSSGLTCVISSGAP
jgi:hypothetical protein